LSWLTTAAVVGFVVSSEAPCCWASPKLATVVAFVSDNSSSGALSAALPAVLPAVAVVRNPGRASSLCAAASFQPAAIVAVLSYRCLLAWLQCDVRLLLRKKSNHHHGNNNTMFADRRASIDGGFFSSRRPSARPHLVGVAMWTMMPEVLKSL